MSVASLRAALAHELLLQVRQPMVFAMLLVTVLAAGAPGLIAMDAWMDSTERAVQGPRDRGDLAVRADAAFAGRVRPGDGLVLRDGPLATRDPVGPDEVLGEVSEEGDRVVLRLSRRVVGASELERRVEAVVARDDGERRAALLDQLGVDPAGFERPRERVERDVAHRDGDRAGRFLGGLLVFVLVTTAMYTAIDVLSGEKEKGTAETLLVTGAPRGALWFAKAVMVFGPTLLAGWSWCGSLWAAQAAGLLDLPNLLGQSAVFTGSTTALLMGATALLAAQISGVALAFGAWAPGYREASIAAAPLMLAVVAPTALGALPQVEPAAWVALVPIGNVAVGMRVGLAGELSAGFAGMVFAGALVHAGLALGLAGWLLHAGDPLDRGLDAEARRGAGRFAQDGLVLAAVALVSFYFLGLLAQNADLRAGLVASLTGLAAIAFAGVAFFGAPMRATMSLRVPSARDAALGLLAGVAMPGLGGLVYRVIAPIVPIAPDAAAGVEALLDGPLVVMLLVGALAPGVCEELLFRGAILGLLRTGAPTALSVLLAGGLFGLMHLDPTRVLVTGVLGVVFGLLVVRSGSLWTAVIAHTTNNAVVFLAMRAAVGAELGGTPIAVELVWSTVCLAAVWGVRGGRPRGVAPEVILGAGGSR